MNPVEEVKLIRLEISITNSWGDIISSYQALSPVLDGKNDARSTSSADNNAYISVSDMSDIGDIGGTGSTDNNFDSKNVYVKAGFSTYNIASANTDRNAGDTIDMGDIGGTSGADNNIYCKNAYAKAGFIVCNVADTNGDTSASVSNMSGTSKEHSNNINNIGKSQSDNVGGADESGMGKTNIETRVGVSRANKGGVGEANIEAGKKASAGAITSTNKSIDGSSKVIDQHIGLANLAFTTLTTANYADNSNLTVLEKTPLGATTSTSDKFFCYFCYCQYNS